MKAAHGLKAETVAQIGGVLASFAHVESAVLFGSRAKGNHRPGSDIDLALTGQALDWRLIGRIEDQLDDLLLPYGFSLVAQDHKLDAAVAAHIARVGQLFYRRETGVPQSS